MKKIILLVVFLMFAGCGMELKPSQDKLYRDETAKLKVLKEHQALQLEILKINTQIAQFRAKVEGAND